MVFISNPVRAKVTVMVRARARVRIRNRITARVRVRFRARVRVWCLSFFPVSTSHIVVFIFVNPFRVSVKIRVRNRIS